MFSRLGMSIAQLVRPFKPWVIPGPAWQAVARNASEVASELKAVTVVAKPSDNLYLGRPVGSLDATSAAIANIASHGEMAIKTIHLFQSRELSSTAERLINILPTKIDLVAAPGEPSVKIGLQSGKLLNHFGYRKIVMNLVPESLADHAWIAAALSYSTKIPSIPQFMFDPVGGSVAGGVAVTTAEGGIFRGSAIADAEGPLITAEESVMVSLAANGVADARLFDKASIRSDEEFVNHRFFDQLIRLLQKPASSAL